MSVFEYMEDFDNDELPDYEHREQLREAVQDYNDEYGTAHDPEEKVIQYFSWKREKFYQR